MSALVAGTRVRVTLWPTTFGQIMFAGPTWCIVRLDNANEISCLRRDVVPWHTERTKAGHDSGDENVVR